MTVAVLLAVLIGLAVVQWLELRTIQRELAGLHLHTRNAPPPSVTVHVPPHGPTGPVR